MIDLREDLYPMDSKIETWTAINWATLEPYMGEPPCRLNGLPDEIVRPLPTEPLLERTVEEIEALRGHPLFQGT